MTCFYIPIHDKALCAWMHSDFFVNYLKTISSNLGSAIRWKKQWIEQCYFYPEVLKKDLENIYHLSVDNPKDGVNKLNKLINKFIQ